MFRTGEQHSDCIPDLQGVYFLSYLLFDFFIFLSLWMVFPQLSCISPFFAKAIIASVEKVFFRALFLFKMD